MSTNTNNISFSNLIEVFSKNSVVNDSLFEEVVHMVNALKDDPTLMEEIDSLSASIDDPSVDPKVYINRLRALNLKVVKAHNPEFVADAEQTPVVLTVNDMSLANLAVFGDDIRIMRKKISGGEGSKAKWETSCEETLGDLRDSGLIDLSDDPEKKTGRRFTGKQKARSLANYCEKNGKMDELKRLLDDSMFISDEQKVWFTPEDSQEERENMVNAFQMDPTLIMAVLIIRSKASPNDVRPQLEQLASAFMKRPLTETWLQSLIKAGKCEILKHVKESTNALFTNPFLMTRSRLSYFLSLWKGVPSRLGLSASRGAAYLLNDIVTIRVKMHMKISESRDDTDWYSAVTSRVLTTPKAEDAWRNRTQVKSNGIWTVKIDFSGVGAGHIINMIEKGEEEQKAQASSGVASVKNYKKSYNAALRAVPNPDNWKDNMIGYVERNSVFVTQKSEPVMSMDIEGTWDNPREICCLVFDPEPQGKGGIIDCILWHFPENMDGNDWCHGLDGKGSDYKQAPEDWKEQLKTFMEAHGSEPICLSGEDVAQVMKSCDIAGVIQEIEPMSPTWEKRSQGPEKAILSLDSCGTCSKTKNHNKRCKGADKRKHTPHCAEIDSWANIVIAMGKIPAEFS
ncbi:nucleoprotein [Wenling frogfish arenavirus 1]|uniref:Nucleoprotein n=1 Tax=Wenling frogfish arenavirus 1 TaxID=2116466 RepID=A0A2P1GNQ7_9VIRU|nr:nucleoprotein [Wenling frogfish arenavirus 1]AVM87642.1 nucleoprotein [Wenling frogfish arenavirus 1]